MKNSKRSLLALLIFFNENNVLPCEELMSTVKGVDVGDMQFIYEINDSKGVAGILFNSDMQEWFFVTEL